MYRIKRPHLYPTILAIIILECTVLVRLSFFWNQPDILLVAVLFFSLFFDYKRSLEVGIAAGLIRDLVTSGFFGINTVLFGAVAFLVSFYSDKIYKDFFMAQVLLTIGAGIFFYSGHFFLNYIIGGADRVEFIGSPIAVIAPAVLYTSFVSPFVFFALSRIFRVARRRTT